MRTFLCAGLCGLTLVAAHAETLTNLDGKIIEAEIGVISGADVVLKVGRKDFKVKLNTLSEESQRRVIAIKLARKLQNDLTLTKLGPDGWNKTKWGMSVDQVSEVYPDALRAPTPEEHRAGLFSCLKIEPYNVAGVKFVVNFLFDKNSALKEVLLTRRGEDRPEGDYNKIRDLIIQKYGDPLSTVKQKKESEGTTTNWATANVTVRLSWLYVNLDPWVAMLSVSYGQPNMDALKKL